MNPDAIENIAPPRLDLARTPTPLEFLPHTSRETGVEIYVKRDDLTGMELSGNKIRKLEFIMADAVAHGADTILTCGGAQSNHARATAIAAARLGLEGCGGGHRPGKTEVQGVEANAHAQRNP